MMTKEYQKKGISISPQKLERNLLEKATKNYIHFDEGQKEQALLSSRAQRQ